MSSFDFDFPEPPEDLIAELYRRQREAHPVCRLCRVRYAADETGTVCAMCYQPLMEYEQAGSAQIQEFVNKRDAYSVFCAEHGLEP